MPLDPNIPLSAKTPDFATPLIRLGEQRRQGAVDAQNQELTDLKIQNERKKLNAPDEAQQQALVKKGLLDTIALSDMLKQFENKRNIDPVASSQILKEAGGLAFGVREDMIKLGGTDTDTDRIDRVMKGMLKDPGGVAKLLDETFIPQMTSALQDDFFRDEDGGQRNLRTNELESAEELTATDEPSAVREFKFFQSLEPEDQERFLNVKRSNPTVDLGDRVVRLAQVPGADPIAELEKELTPVQEPENIAAAEEARKTKTLEVQRTFDAGGAQGTLNVVNSQSQTMLDAIDKIAEHPGTKTAVGLGSVNPLTLGSRIPTTESNDARVLIDQLKDRIFVESLQNIRASSPTGGAVGQVSDREGSRLENMLGALDRTQGDEQFLEQLGLIRAQVVNMIDLSKEAFESEFGDINLTGDTELDAILQAIENQ